MKAGSRIPLALSAVVLCLSVLAAGAWGGGVRDWRKQLRAEDPFERLLAALALCEARPGRSAPAIPVLFRAIRSEVPRDRAAAERAVQSIAEFKLEALAEYLVLAGRDRPVVGEVIGPLVAAGPPGTGEALLAAWRREDWQAPGVVRALLVERARTEAEFARHLESEHAAAEGADRQVLMSLMRAARPDTRGGNDR